MPALDEVIASHREEILTRWLQQARNLAPGSATSQELQNELPTFLVELAAALRRERGLAAGPSPLPDSSGAAAAHGRAAVRLGLEPGALVRQYGLLHLTILDVARSAGCTPSVSEVQLLAAALVTGLSEAMREHARFKRTQAELPFRLFVDAVKDYAIYMLDPHGYVVSWNAGAERIKGYTREEIIGAHFSKFYPPAEAASGKPARDLEQAATSGRLEASCWRVRKDGRRFFADVSVTPIRDDDGSLVGFAKITRDVTEQRRLSFLGEASLILGESLDYERTIAEVAKVTVPFLADWCAVHLVDGDALRTVAVSHVDPAKMELARSFEQRFPPARSDASHGAWHVIRTGQAELHREITEADLVATISDPDERALIRTLGLSSAILVPLEVGGQVLGALTLAQAESGRAFGEADLALAGELASRCARAIDNARVHREVAREGEWLTAVVQQMPVGVVIALAPSGRIRVYNDQAKQLLGTEPEPANLAEALKAQRFDSAGRPLPPDARPLPRALRGEVVETEMSVGRPDGTRLPVWTRAAPVRDKQGQLLGAVSTFADISARKQEEERTRQEAEFRERFIAILGHDLRNPLAAILTSARLLDRKSPRPDQLRMVNTINSCAERMTRMIEQLLDLARSRLGGGIPVAPRKISLRRLVGQAVEELRAAHPGSEIEVAAPSACEGLWDPDRMSQMLTNLVGNAIEHGAARGTISVALSEDAHQVRLVVHNLGEPIPRTALRFLFDPFRRARAKPSTSRGLGLGLFITAQIVKAHHGHIEVRSTRAAGTTFTVQLPKQPLVADGTAEGSEPMPAQPA